MNTKLKKIDVIIVIGLIIVSIYVFTKVGYIDNPLEIETPDIDFRLDDENNILVVEYVSTEVFWKDINISGEHDDSSLGKKVQVGDQILECRGTISIYYLPTGVLLGSFSFSEKEVLPKSFITSNERSVSPEDEGPHYNDLLVSREWWYYTVIFNNGLKDWSLSISFNHMSRTDLFFEKPDFLLVTLHGPDGEEYGGIIERERPILGFLKEPSLQAKSSDKGFKVTFEESYIQGKVPNWRIHIESNEFKNNLEIDIGFFAPNSPIWTFSNRLLDKSNGKIASYIFTGCEVDGTIKIDGITYKVNGIGHHEHTWVSGIIPKALIRGWDWCHMTLDNGWNIYYSNYYFLPQVKSTKTSKINPFGDLIITTDKGASLTRLENIDIEIVESDQIMLFLNIPNYTKVTAKPKSTQIILESHNINLDLDIKADNTYEKLWKRFANIGMKIGKTTISGKISWTDNEGKHDIELNGIGTIWNMRH